MTCPSLFHVTPSAEVARPSEARNGKAFGASGWNYA